jgi:hypothetical protein
MRFASLRSFVGCGFFVMGLALCWSLSECEVGAQQKKSLPEIIAGWKAQPEFQAKIEAIQGATIYVLNFANERIAIQVMPQPITKTISVKGTGEISAIKSGLGMRFAGKVDEAGVVADKVAEFYLVTPDYMPEFSLNEDTEIVGKINSFDPKTSTIKLAVNAVKKELKGEKEVTTKKVKLATLTLAEEPKINVDLKDLSLAHKNDMITVSGKVARNIQTNQEIPNSIIAESVVIDLAEPLSFGKKRVAPAPAGKTEKVDPFAEANKQANGEDPKAETKKEEGKKADPKKAADKK